MEHPEHRQFVAMGGPCDLHLYRQGKAADEVVSEAEHEVRRLEAKYSRFRPDSYLSQLNRRAVAGLEVDDETAGLLNFADQCFRQSQGLFDITTGVLRSVWNFKQQRLPEPTALQTCLQRVGWHRVKWQAPYLKLPAGMELDLGGLVKEFAADRVMAILIEHERCAMVNLAGDIRVTGPRADGSPWPVGIRHPRKAAQVAAWVPLVGGALATSGDYERFIEVKGQRFCHILNPETGYPCRHGPASVTVIAESCLLAGALSTIAMLQGKDAESWLVSLGVPFLLFDEFLTVSGTLKTGSD